jgi:hypothetical protein
MEEETNGALMNEWLASGGGGGTRGGGDSTRGGGGFGGGGLFGDDAELYGEEDTPEKSQGDEDSFPKSI